MMPSASWDVSTDLVPVGSRLPNSLLWVTWEAAPGGRILAIESRSPDDDASMF
jgi:hypothetical protein